MKYLVLRSDALNYAKYKNNRNTIRSSCFPIEVEVTDDEFDEYGRSDSFFEYVVRRAFDSINEGYTGMYEYIVVPMDRAWRVNFKPRPVYDVSVRSYDRD